MNKIIKSILILAFLLIIMVGADMSSFRDANEIFPASTINHSDSPMIVKNLTIIDANSTGQTFACFTSEGVLFPSGVACV